MSGPYDLQNKVVLVTGASQGLGKQFAEILSANGARVALAARQVSKITSLKEELENKGSKACAVEMDVLDQERKVAELKAAESGKPEAIAAKMVEGQVQKYLKEVTLTSQPFVKDPGMNVETYLKNADTTIKSYAFYVVGEGIEKKEDTFVAEVEAAAAKVAAAAAAAGN